MTTTVIPKSDQINADDLITGSVTATIVDVRKGDAEQPVKVVLDLFGEGRPYKPGKSMRRVMIEAWGPDSGAYIGKRLTLFREPRVRFGPDEVGGIRISHMSGIPKRLTVALTATRGKRVPYVVEPLPDLPANQPTPSRADQAVAAFAGIGVSVEDLEERVGKPRDQWQSDELAALLTYYQEASHPATSEAADQ